MSHPSRRAALHVVPTWMLVLLAGLGLTLAILVGGDPAHASEFVAASVDEAGPPLIAAGMTLLGLSALALMISIAALVVVLSLELRRRRSHGQG